MDAILSRLLALEQRAMQLDYRIDSAEARATRAAQLRREAASVDAGALLFNSTLGDSDPGGGDTPGPDTLVRIVACDGGFTAGSASTLTPRYRFNGSSTLDLNAGVSTTGFFYTPNTYPPVVTAEVYVAPSAAPYAPRYQTTSLAGCYRRAETWDVHLDSPDPTWTAPSVVGWMPTALNLRSGLSATGSVICVLTYSAPEDAWLGHSGSTYYALILRRVSNFTAGVALFSAAPYTGTPPWATPISYYAPLTSGSYTLYYDYGGGGTPNPFVRFFSVTPAGSTPYFTVTEA